MCNTCELLCYKNGTSDGYSFSEANYKVGNSGSGHTLSGSFQQGDDTYDAAAANMGSPWKMPTKTQCEELINNTTSQWTTINGKNGRKFTSKSNSTKYIFLPPTGYWYLTNHGNAGTYGYYWCANKSSSSAGTMMIFNSNGISWGYYAGFRGHSIRPIR